MSEHNRFYKNEEPLDPNSPLDTVYSYLMDNPDEIILPDDVMPQDYQVYYVFQQVKNLRDGTGLPKLTYLELLKIMEEELDDWRSEKPPLPKWFLDKHGLDTPIIRKT